MKVEQYGLQQQQTQVANQPRMNTPRVADMTPIAAGLKDLVKGISIGKQRYDETQAEEALNAFQKEQNEMFFNPETGYFNRNGKDAYEGSEDVQSNITKIRDKYASQLNSPDARNAFNRASNSLVNRGQQAVMKHASRGLQEYEAGVIEARVAGAADNAALYWNSDDDLKKNMGVGIMAIKDAAEIAGESEEATNEKTARFLSGSVTNAVTAAMQADFGRAEQLFKEYEGALTGEDKVNLTAKLASQRDAIVSKNEVAIVNSTASTIMSKAGTNLGEAARLIAGVDPQLQAKVRNEYLSQQRMYKQAQEQTIGEAVDDAEKYLMTDGANINTWIGMNKGRWNMLSAKQQTELLEGRKIETPFEIAVQVDAAMKNNDKGMAESLLKNYGGHMSTAHKSKLGVFVQTDDKYTPPKMNDPLIARYRDGLSDKEKLLFDDALTTVHNQYYNDNDNTMPDNDWMRQTVSRLIEETPSEGSWFDKPMFEQDDYVDQIMFEDAYAVGAQYIPLDQPNVESATAIDAIYSQWLRDFRTENGRYPNANDFKANAAAFENLDPVTVDPDTLPEAPEPETQGEFNTPSPAGEPVKLTDRAVLEQFGIPVPAPAPEDDDFDEPVYAGARAAMTSKPVTRRDDGGRVYRFDNERLRMDVDAAVDVLDTPIRPTARSAVTNRTNAQRERTLVAVQDFFNGSPSYEGARIIVRSNETAITPAMKDIAKAYLRTAE